MSYKGTLRNPAVMTDHVCDAAGCQAPAERSLNIKKVAPTGMELKDPDARQVHLCKEHYRSWKKMAKDAIPDYLGN